ncbi:2-succinyl-5-enolpyruvyl-6-hydroxy-3-cyclohexene-1-carboxylic-acid synthase [Flavimobilis sp. GY10621]|uniref:2-succinyl-5-enolpyruvyl-6-hydroxy-3-cyclohexene-1-carboxylate synthase n=1 Tax=Flavimobilis rhizosphaerae TaxID=2775421 RepID=A0ABR9DNI2_9MICO|nr:2-succinyl-5-enolpyruvyl-6-hydroxy-3-cyclohexene-1-carboxylic-acid synthase [Flavimobilis rhizosphaerae]MBD9698688.1 2-succinyl-5-enolpyruvyl-6-hydroxy-3-cyclohexene-1-carboxylic-acid synthase [Flavimobilis rhizosphaerae]
MTSPSYSAARTLLAALVRLGVREVVLAPGSRSAPLAYAAAEAAEEGLLELTVRVDEREAAFTAVGLVRGAALGRGPGAPGGAGHRGVAPVAVVTTSGTAVANLHPAVLEAHHAGLPLLLLTADRPHELRGTGASQTIDQPGIFGGAVRLAVDVPAPDGREGEERDLVHLAARAVDAASGTRSGFPGPVQLNLAFRDPLVPGADDAAPWPDVRPPRVSAPMARPLEVSPWTAGELTDGGTLVVAGDGDRGEARALAEARGWPLLAECVTPSAGGPMLVPAHAHVLAASPLTADVRRVVVVGRPTLSRPVQRLVAREDVDVVVVAPQGAPWADAPRGAGAVLPEVPLGWFLPDDMLGDGLRTVRRERWRDAWRAAGAAAAAAIDDVLGLGTAEDGPRGARVADATATTGPVGALTAEGAVRVLADALVPADVLVVGSSNPVRDLDLVHRWVAPPRVVANRGVAGIDGLLATAVGTALALSRPGLSGIEGRTVRALVGDLTFLHGAGGLAAARGEGRPQLQIVVVNDAGGSIFTGLEHGALAEAAPARAAAVERVFGTPHDVDLGALCAAHGVPHVVVEDADALRSALASPGRGTCVVEVRVDRAGRRSRASAVADALRSRLARPSAS